MKSFRIAALVAVVLVALITILGKGGGDAPANGGNGGGGQTADFAGTWTTTTTVIDDTCGLEPGEADLGPLMITQSGASVTITDLFDETFTGMVTGDVMTFSGSFTDDGDQISIDGTATINGDSMSGTLDATVTGSGGSCNVSLSFTGTRTSGGGGSGGSGTPIALNIDNAEQVTQAVLQTAANVQELPALLPFAVEIDKIQAGPASAAVVIAALVNETLERAKLGALPVGIVEEEPCDESGKISTDTTGAGFQVGDTIVTTYIDCVDDVGEGPLVGVVTLTVTEVDDSLMPPAFGLVFTMNFDGFGTAAQPEPFSFDGDATVSVSSPDGAVEFTIEISLTSLTHTVNGIPQLFNDYTARIVINLNTLVFTFSALGVVDIPGLGTVSFETIGPFDFFAPGQVIITGDGSTIDCIALDNVTVTLEIDSDGDGTVDDTISTTWVALLE
jgi:hypothetical protein